MSKSLIHPRMGALTVMILIAGAWRLFISGTHTPLHNFTPVGAMAIFGGCYYANRWKAYLVPLLTLWLSDILLCYFIYYHKLVFFYEGFLWTYASFALMVFIGSFIRKVNVKNILLAGVGAALAHWIITDFGVWAFGLDFTTGKPFTKDIQGLLKCYALALPYLKNMLMGNLVFGAVMFGAFEWAQRKYPGLQVSPQINAA